MRTELTASLALVLALVGLRVRARWRSWRAQARARRAIRGERDAEPLLASLGYAIEARQLTGALELEVDGALHTAPLRCDLVVSRGGLRYVAEVKTGARAPRLDHAPTRRQLVEYLVAFALDGALLVDREAGTVREIRLRERARSQAWAWAWALVAGIAIGAAIVLAAR